MAKLTLDDVGNLNTAGLSTINANSGRIETALENTLSRDGTSPNQMSADIDMNHNDLLNVGSVAAADITVDGQSIGDAVDDAATSATAAAASATDAAASATDAAASAASLDTDNIVHLDDTDASGFDFVVDEDDMASDSDTKVPTQQSVKAYVDSLPAPTAATRSVLKGLSASAGDVRYLIEAGREGDFKFSSSDLSTFVTADTEEGVYVAPTSDATGASGAWVRQSDGILRPEWFGASAAGTRSANKTALQAAVDFAQLYTGELFLPAMYFTDGAISITSNIRVRGVSAFTSGISCNSGNAISLVPSNSVTNNNTWWGFFNFSAIATVGSYGIGYASTDSEYLSNWIMEGVFASGTSFGANFDSSGSTIGIFSCTFRRNWFDNGLHIKSGGDSITIIENTVNGVNGILIEGLKTGARQLVIRNNNTSSLSECIFVKDVTNPIVEENWAETPSYLGDYTGASGAIVYFSNCPNARIRRNTIQPLASVADFTAASYAITLAGTSDGIIIDDNDIAIGGTGHINIAASTITNTVIGGQNKYDVTSVITDSGVDTIGGSFDHVVKFKTSTAFATVASFESTEAGTGNGPMIDAYRNSASPADGDGLAVFGWFGNNSSAAKINYGYIGCTAISTTAASEQGRVNIATYYSGALTIRMQVSNGVVIGSGVMKGDGSLNITAVGYHYAGTKVLGAQATGWTAATGTANKGTYATYAGQTHTASYVQATIQALDDAVKAASQRIKALEDMLRTHGLMN